MVVELIGGIVLGIIVAMGIIWFTDSLSKSEMRRKVR